MATTEIHAVTVTPERALGYVVSHKVVDYVSEEQINKDVAYYVFESNGGKFVQYLTLTCYQNCDTKDPYSTYQYLQDKWQGTRYKNGGTKSKNGQEPLVWHLHQSFDGWEVSPETANEIGRKLAEEIFEGFAVTISTHCNTGNIHNHFIISAWNNDGKKWNNCNANYQKIRRVSDRLCEEYGLNVLEETRDVKLIQYKDAEGKTHYYEPTERKNELIRKREAGENTTDDVNSYRNTPQYEEKESKKETNRAEIKKDIDTLLSSCRSYEELLLRLQELGYIISAKKKNGDWKSHVSFQAPGHEKATREDKIGDGTFYVRENLTRYIEEKNAGLEIERIYPRREDEPKKTISYISGYEYGKTKLGDIDDNYRSVRDENGEFRTVRRTATEQKILSDIRAKDSQVRGLIDTTQLDKIITEQNNQRRQRKPYLTKTEEQRLVAEIQSGFRCLQYTEQHHIYSYEQIIDLYAASKGKYDLTIDNFTKSEKAIEHLKEVLLVPQKLSDVMNKMESHRNDINYILEEYNEDKKMVAQYKAMLSKYKIDTPQGQRTLEQKVSEFEAKQNVNRMYMTRVVMQMAELENCIRTFDRIDSERGNRNVTAMREFEKIARPKEARRAEERKKKERRREEHDDL